MIKLPQRMVNRINLALGLAALTALAVAWLLLPRAAAAIWLAAIAASLIFGVLLLGYYQDDALWWLPASAGVMLALAAALLSSRFWPGSRLMLTLGLVFGAAGLGWASVLSNRKTPGYVLTFIAVCLFASVTLLVYGLGYRLWTVSLVLLALAYDLAVTSLYLPSKLLYATAAAAATAAIFLAPQPAASLRLLLPLLLVIGGLRLMQTSRCLPSDTPTTAPRSQLRA